VSGLFRRGRVCLRNVIGEVGLVFGRDRRGRISVLTFPERSHLCRDKYGEFGLISVLVRHSRVIFVTRSARSG